MKSNSQNQGSLVRMSALVVIILGLSACGHYPPKESTMGDQFLGKRTVEMVYQADHGKGQYREYTPINKEDEFEIIREPGTSNKFKFVPGENFTGNAAWSDLVLEYQSGIDTKEPIPLIAEICANNQTSEPPEGSVATQGRQYNYINTNVQNDFLNLDGRGLEFLESDEPIIFNKTPHTIHIFHIVKIGAKKPSLVIFYCETDRCNHNGMIDAR